MGINYEGKVFSGSSSIFKSNDRRLTLRKVTEANIDAINALLIASIDVFVAAAVKAMVVGPDTGMSVASFTALASLLGASPQKIQGLANAKAIGEGLQAVNNGISSRKIASRPNYSDITGATVSAPRNVETGELLGRKAYDITFATATSGITNFKFTAVVWQHAALMPESLEAGVNAMKAFLETNTTNYLNPLRILRKFLNI